MPLEVPSGNISIPPSSFKRLAPSFVQTENIGNSWAIIWNNNLGNHANPVQSAFFTTKIPTTATAILMRVEGYINGSNTLGNLNEISINIFSDDTFTNIADHGHWAIYEFVATPINKEILHTTQLMVMPIINNNVYVNIAGTIATPNIDYFPVGYWD